MKTAHLLKERQVIKLVFPLDGYVISKLTALPFLVQKSGYWEVPVSIQAIEILKKLNFEFSKALENWKENDLTYVTEKTNTPKKLKGLKLYPYQLKGVQFIEEKQGRALIADEMGLGKTVEALAWLKLHPENRPVLIICPSSLKINWKRECSKWVKGAKTSILEGSTPYDFTGNIIIINYDILQHWVSKLKTFGFNTIIVDEAHYIKNNSAKRTKAFKRIIKDVTHLIALTGTPIENRPIEIYNIVHAINPQIFPDYMMFAREFCGAKKDRFGWDMSGATNTKRLNSILKHSIMIRRKKADVLKELPSKLIVKVPIEIDNRRKYVKAEEQFIAYVREKFSGHVTEEIEAELKRFAKDNKIKVGKELSNQDIQMLKMEKFRRAENAPILAQIETLKQLAVEGKLAQITDWIENFLDSSNEKLVVFAIHKKTIEALIQRFPDAVKIDGSVSMQKRQRVVDLFQNDPNTRLFIGNIKAAGVGITLTAASNAAIIEFPWSPGELAQAADRIHRITQTKQVTIYNLIGENTIEERILRLLKNKENIIDKVLDGKQGKDSTVLVELIKSYF